MIKVLNYLSIVFFFCFILSCFVVISSLETNNIYDVNLVNEFISENAPQDICQIKYGSVKTDLLIEGNIELKVRSRTFSSDFTFVVSTGENVEMGELIGYDENHQYFAEEDFKVVEIEYGEINKIHFINSRNVGIVTHVGFDVYSDINHNTVFQVHQNDEWVNLEFISYQKDIQTLTYKLEFLFHNTDDIYNDNSVITIKVVNEDDSLDYYFNNKCINNIRYDMKVEVELFNLVSEETRVEIVDIVFLNQNISIIQGDTITTNDLIIEIRNTN